MTLEPYEAPTPDIFRERDPHIAIARYSEIAQAVGNVIKEQNLYVAISGRKHVRIEGWQALGAPFGIFAQVTQSGRIQDGDRWGYEATADAHRFGEMISSADAECWSDETNWKGKPDFQVRSMAQTRACAKALRLALGFVMAMAGYEATPAEEMVAEQPAIGRGKKRSVPAKAPSQKPQQNGPNYTYFWATVRDLGLQSGEVHGVLKVVSLKDWVDAGQTLDAALVICKTLADLIQQGWGHDEAIAETRRQHFEPEQSQEVSD